MNITGLESIANIKDFNTAIVKEMKVISSQFKEGMSLMNQLSNMVMQSARAECSSSSNHTIPAVQQLAMVRPPRPVTMTLQPFLCFMCKSPEHMMGDCPHYTVMSCEVELSKLDMSDINFQNNTTNEFNYQLFNSEGWHGQSIRHMN